MPYYTGIGSRSTPPTILAAMESIAATLYERGWRLRSGAAEGADQAFGRGALDRADIYVPWRGFGHAERGARVVKLADDWVRYPVLTQLLAVGCPHHDRLSHGALKLHARNVHQVVGDVYDASEHQRGHDDPSRFVVCWTPGGRVTGGTATAIRIAEVLGVRVFNLGVPGQLALLAAALQTTPDEPRRPRSVVAD